MLFREFLKDNIVRLDGAMGTLLQERGLKVGELPERWNITNSGEIIAIHKAYFDAGANTICANTFGANSLKFSSSELDEIVYSAMENAKKARTLAGKDNLFIALDIGPTGKMLQPYGDLPFEEAVEVFAKTIRLGAKYGADLIFIETINDCYETKAAVLAAKENCDLPVLVCNAYGSDKKLTTGATPTAMAVMLEGLGVDGLGANCSLGPTELAPVVEELLNATSLPIIVKPNAGLPKWDGERTTFDIDETTFAESMQAFVEKGVGVIGGCCGTTPNYIRALTEKTQGAQPKKRLVKRHTSVSSYTHAVTFEDRTILIGERINPTGKKRFKQALKERDIGYILNEGVSQAERGADILDVNVGLPEIDESEMLSTVVCELQAVVDLPLQIDTADIKAMERALRLYNGKPMINSVNGKKESMQSVFPLAKKYGGVVVALTLDENGIPETAEGRFEIAKRILACAKEYGIREEDIIFDTLTMAISADKNAGKVTLDALEMIKNQLSSHTCLGVSNISFGLPNRDAINSIFFTLAMEKGLSAAILNPYSLDMLKAYHSYNAVNGLDENFEMYTKIAPTLMTTAVATATVEQVSTQETALAKAIEKGFKEESAKLCKELLKDKNPLAIVTDEIIPALNAVGEGFENKRVFLPQLLMSAEAAKSAFEEIKKAVSVTGENAIKKGVIVLATVKGDIHDIGKNIVKLILENYGYAVVDLGKDVDEEKIIQAVKIHRAPLLGLSALMTTTAPNMASVIKRVKEETPWCKVVVGGAVLTQEYADKIGADKYAKDAMESVRYAESVIG